jgi:nucleotide-binding universal stress UspA family protein
MIKRILVALDPDEDTPIATQYALRLAKRFNASLTGLAVIDTSNLRSVIGVGGYGTEAIGREMWLEMTEETKEVAEMLLRKFENDALKANVKHQKVKKQGSSDEMILEESKYHDMLVVGRDSRFFYNEPEKDTGTLAKVVKGGVAPTLVVTHEYRDVEKLLIAFDGSAAAARSLKSFVHLLPYGKDLDMQLVFVTVNEREEDENRAMAILKQAESYLHEHHFSYVTKHLLSGKKPAEKILEIQHLKKPDLVVLGAHSVSAIRRAAFGSTTHRMITESEGPLFLSP